MGGDLLPSLYYMKRKLKLSRGSKTMRQTHVHQFERNKATNNRPFRFVWSGLPNVYLSGIDYGACSCGMREGHYPQAVQLVQTLTELVRQKQSRLNPLEIKYLRKSTKKSH